MSIDDDTSNSEYVSQKKVIENLLPRHEVRLAFYMSVGIIVLAFLTFGYMRTGVEEWLEEQGQCTVDRLRDFTMLSMEEAVARKLLSNWRAQS